MATADLSKAKTKTNGHPASSETDSDIAAIREDLASLKSDVLSLVSSIGGVAKAKSDRSVSAGQDLAEDLSAKAKDAASTVEEQVRANPMASVGLALGAGYLIAKLRG